MIRGVRRQLGELTEDLNGRTMRTYKASRRELFDRLDKPALAPLPGEPFEASAWMRVALNIDYHLAFEHYFCLAPHALRHEGIELWVRATASTIEVFHGRERAIRFDPHLVVLGALRLGRVRWLTRLSSLLVGQLTRLSGWGHSAMYHRSRIRDPGYVNLHQGGDLLTQKGTAS